MGYPFRSRLEHDPRGNIAVIQMKDIDNANLLHAEEAIKVTLPKGKAHHLLRAGDLAFRSRGRSNDATLVQEGIGAAVLSAPMLLIRPHGVLPEYLCWFINAPATQAQLAALAEDTSVQMISAEALKALDVPLPSLAAQQRIAQATTLAEQEQTLLAQIATLRQRLTTHILMTFAHEPTPWQTSSPNKTSTTLPYVRFKDERTGVITDRFLADFHALCERRKAANLGELINFVLDHIEEANKAKLEGVFRSIDFNSEANLGKT